MPHLERRDVLRVSVIGLAKGMKSCRASKIPTIIYYDKNNEV